MSAIYQSGTFNTIGKRSGSIGGHFPVWSRVDKIYQGGGKIDVTNLKAGDVIGAGTMVVFAGPGQAVKVVNASVAFDAAKTYKVGDIVVKDGKVLECKTAIASAESYTAGHWTDITSSINGLIFEDVCIPEGCELATCAVVRAGRIYADRVASVIPASVEPNLPMIEFVRE